MRKINLLIIVMLLAGISTVIVAQDFALNFYDNGFSLKNTVTTNGINVDGYTSISAEAWCNLASYKENATILIKENGNICESSYVSFKLFVDISGHSGFGIGNGSEFIMATSSESIPLNEWHHIAGTWDGTTIRVYIDGIEMGVSSASGQLYDGGFEMNIGNRWECARRPFDGMIDEVRLWSDSRTEMEISQNMHGALANPLTETDLIVYYDFNEGAGDVVSDLSSNGYNGLLGNIAFPSGITTAPEWVISTIQLVDCPVVDLGENKKVYFGYDPMECTTLEANITEGTPPYSLLWSTGETTESIEVCPEENTIYTLTVTDANQCIVTNDILVEVEDVRCGWGNNKVLVCHTSFFFPDYSYNVCVGKWLVPLLLYFGDELGECIEYKSMVDLEDIPDFESIEEIRAFDQKNYLEIAGLREPNGHNFSEIVIAPNPVAGSAKIHFEVSTRDQTSIELVNSLGQVVKQLYNGVSEKDKIYTVEFNGRKFNNGIYFVRLVNGNEVMQQKISIVN